MKIDSDLKKEFYILWLIIGWAILLMLFMGLLVPWIEKFFTFYFEWVRLL